MKVLFLLFLLIFSSQIWGAQDAVVVVDRAVIYSDQQMSSPIGFVRKGKRVTIGEIPRYRAQVYPIVVSGRIAYIRGKDLSTEMLDVESGRLVAERFFKSTKSVYEYKYSLNYLNFTSQVDLNASNNTLVNQERADFHGASLRGEVTKKNKWDLQVIVNYLTSTAQEGQFRFVEFGGGGALRLIKHERWDLKWELQGLIIPFAQYSIDNDLRVNGTGITAASGLNLSWRAGMHWGIETFAGVAYSKLFGMDFPEPVGEISPTFYGTRFGAGLNYQF